LFALSLEKNVGEWKGEYGDCGGYGWWGRGGGGVGVECVVVGIGLISPFLYSVEFCCGGCDLVWL